MDEFLDVCDALAQALRARCQAPALNVALPWDTLTEPEREAWRTLGLAALHLCGPRDESALLRAIVRSVREALRPYVRHLDGCAGAPCRCGLTDHLGA